MSAVELVRGHFRMATWPPVHRTSEVHRFVDAYRSAMEAAQEVDRAICPGGVPSDSLLDVAMDAMACVVEYRELLDRAEAIGDRGSHVDQVLAELATRLNRAGDDHEGPGAGQLYDAAKMVLDLMNDLHVAIAVSGEE